MFFLKQQKLSWQLSAQIAAVAVIAVTPIINSLNQAPKTMYRDRLDIFLDAINLIAFVPLFPLLIVFISALPLFSQQTHRQFVSSSLRMPARQLLKMHLFRGCALVSLAFFLFILLAGIYSFYVTPQLSVYMLNSQAYGLSEAQLSADSLQRSTFTEILRFGVIPFLVVYAAWTAAAAAVFCLAGMASVLLIKNRVVALLAPWLLYLGETAAAAVLVGPQVALAYSVFPSGIATVSPVLLGTPLLVTALLAGSLWLRVYRRPELGYGLT